MAAKTIKILDDAQVRQMLKRIAYQVYENNFDEKQLVIAGIEGRGATIAAMLEEQLNSICKIKTSLLVVSIDKENPSRDSVTLDNNNLQLTDRCIVVVDDVLNTGKTLIYSLVPFMRSKAKKIQTAVLVDRNHKKFPVSADFIGMSLSTTLQEHVTVTIEKNKVNVFLS